MNVTAGSVFGRSWELLNRNWSIVVPGLIVALVSGALTALLLPTMAYVDGTGVTVVQRVGGFRTLIALVVQLFSAIVAVSYTTGMAFAAWQRGVATFADGATAFRTESGNVFTAFLALFIGFVVAAIVAPFTLFLSLFAYFFFSVYALPAAVIGDRGGFGALAESYRTARSAAGTTAIVILVLAVILFIAGAIGGALAVIPFLGPLVAELVVQAALAYFTLVLVGEYLNVRRRTRADVTSTGPLG